MKFSIALALLLPPSAPAANKPEIKFRKGRLELAGQTLAVEVAETPREHERGLMFRQSLAENEGMLFIFKDEVIRHFWMKNTFVDLDIAFFDSKKKFIEVYSVNGVRSVMEEPASVSSSVPALYVLEVPKGWFAKRKVKKGSEFRLK